METIGMVVMSLDGCLTRHDAEGTAFASAADRKHFQAALEGCDCTLLGGGGYRAAREAIRASLTPRRLRLVRTREPERYAGDARAGQLEFRAGEPAALLRGLAGRGFTRCAVPGGTDLLTQCLRERLLDELWVTVEPVLFGRGRRLVEGDLDVRLALLGAERLGEDTLLLRYRPG
jgi:dihydrofolate reductase